MTPLDTSRGSPERDLAFEDFEPGAETSFGRYLINRDEMVGFARLYDPQPFHLDEEAARSTGTGQLIASGWYNCAVQMRMMCDGWLDRTFCLGSPGVEEVRWLRPVVAGDVLHCRQTILDTRASSSRPGMGIMRFQIELANGRDEIVMRTRHLVMLGRRGAPPPQVAAPRVAAGEPPLRHPAEDVAHAPRGFEEVEIGRAIDLGTFEFTADRIVAFARSFDSQSFHLSEAGGAAGPFGALAASGWHTTAAWMSRFAARLARLAEAGRPPRVSVSPGYRDLRWLRPVYAGETIRFGSEPIEKRPLASRPGWGLVSSRNTGWNAAGETVLEFTGNAFWAMEGTEGALAARS